MVKDCVAELSERLGIRATKRGKRLLVMVIIALELYVADDSKATYSRYWAGFELLKVWGGLRLSDHWGIPPDSVRLTRRGLSAKLLESKTTGPGRRVEELPVWIGSGAWLATPEWLGLFKKLVDNYASERKFLMPRPKADLEQAYLESKVEYAQAAGMSMALMEELMMPDWKLDRGRWGPHQYTKLILVPDMVVFWSQHSARNFLISSSVSQGFSKDERRMAARHKPEASEEYVRTQRQITERMQDRVAEAMRAGYQQEDAFDEEEVYQEIAEFLASRGVEETKIQEQLSRLAYFNPDKRVPRTSTTGSGGGTGNTREEPEMNGAASAGLNEEEDDDDGFDPAPRPRFDEAEDEDAEEAGNEAPAAEEAGEEVDLDDEGLSADELNPRGFVVTRKGTLHFVGQCWRRPWIDYIHFTPYGETPSEEVRFTNVCSGCWKDKVPSFPDRDKDPEAPELKPPEFFPGEEKDEDGSGSGSDSTSSDSQDSSSSEDSDEE
jgi:hypothetical protein